AEAAKLSKNTSKAVMVLTIVERHTAKTAYLSGKINTIQLPDVRIGVLDLILTISHMLYPRSTLR
ncbi:MAG: hypothetical protein H9847_06255, partial [Candidatus Anaerobiospirillum pullicola]|nr:hypothetical protein [Candidatus Anaerobiospirillum pullicola]